MKKLPAKFKPVFIGLMMFSYMITCLPLLLVLINAPEGAPIFEIYKANLVSALTNVVPYAMMLAIPGILFFNLVLGRLLFKAPNES